MLFIIGTKEICLSVCFVSMEYTTPTYMREKVLTLMFNPFFWKLTIQIDIVNVFKFRAQNSQAIFKRKMTKNYKAKNIDHNLKNNFLFVFNSVSQIDKQNVCRFNQQDIWYLFWTPQYQNECAKNFKWSGNYHKLKWHGMILNLKGETCIVCVNEPTPFCPSLWLITEASENSYAMYAIPTPCQLYYLFLVAWKYLL